MYSFLKNNLIVALSVCLYNLKFSLLDFKTPQVMQTRQLLQLQHYPEHHPLPWNWWQPDQGNCASG